MKNKAKRPTALLGDRDDAEFAHGGSARGHPLVREAGQRECRAPEAWSVLRLVFLRKPNTKLEKGIRGFRAIALLSMFSKWYTTVLVELLHEEKEPIEWRNLHVGAVRAHAGVTYEHTAETLEWQEDRRTD